jgi:hypothetical protein
VEDTLSQKRFWWGLLLAWAPWVPTMIVLGYLFIGVSNSKATGLAAVAGGMVELLVWWGLGAMLISQIAAIVWLSRSFSSTHIFRSVVAAASVFASGITLFLIFAFLFWGRRLLEQASSH